MALRCRLCTAVDAQFSMADRGRFNEDATIETLICGVQIEVWAGWLRDIATTVGCVN